MNKLHLLSLLKLSSTSVARIKTYGKLFSMTLVLLDLMSKDVLFSLLMSEFTWVSRGFIFTVKKVGELKEEDVRSSTSPLCAQFVKCRK